MDNKKYAVVAENINKCYKMYSGQKEKFLDLVLSKGAGKTFYALKDISFKVEKGEIVGLLGLNGAGKSTLSNILGGVSLPNSGKITINGESSLIAIGLGLNNFLTGLENIEVKALMMGYKKDEIEKIKQEVIEFAEIGDFINQPIRTYSSGMRSRLGFGISIHMNPDILVIDEALSVGDPTFAQKCLDKMNEFKESGKTIFFVSHSLPQVKQFCNKAMWLEYGTLREYGDVNEILPKYQKYIDQINKMTKEEKLEYKKGVLKNHEHSLVSEFKIVDPRLKKIIPSGKIIKYAKVVNKKLNIKSIPYNFDFYTMVLGAFPSIFRGKIDTAILIFMAQVLNFLIIPFPLSIMTNFLVGSIAGIFTGRNYVEYLIDEKGYIPYHIWRSNLENEQIDLNTLSKVNKALRKANRKNLISLSSTLIFSIISIFTFAFIQYRPSIENKVAEISHKMVIENFAIINISNKDKNYINDILILNTDSINNELKGVIYPGGLQVNTDEGSDEMKNILEDKNIEDFKALFLKEFGIDINNYIYIYGDGNENEEYYNQKINDFIATSEDNIEDIIKNIHLDNSSIEKYDIKNFYEKFNSDNSDMEIKFEYSKYQEVSLLDFIDKDVLMYIDREDLYDYDFLVMDKRMLQNSKLINEIKKQHEELEEKEREEKEREEKEREESFNNNNSNNNTTPGGGTTRPGGGSTTPGGGTTRPGGGSETPGGGSETPGGGSTTPGGGSETPGGGSTTPGGGSETPGGGSETPGDGSTTPGGGSTTPEDGNATIKPLNPEGL